MTTACKTRMRMAANKELEIYIYSEIGESWYAEGITADSFAKELRAAGRPSSISIRINSSGGDVFDGLAIYNLLRAQPVKKTVYIDGVALSIASIIAMAGDEIQMAANAHMMIHDPWGGFVGNADELRRHADVMDGFKESLVNTYAARTKLTPDVVSRMMSEETWMGAQLAFENGFVDVIARETAIKAAFDPERSHFRNVPKELAHLAKNKVQTPNLNAHIMRLDRMAERVLAISAS